MANCERCGVLIRGTIHRVAGLDFCDDCYAEFLDMLLEFLDV